jgi:hypothetical protein
MPGRQLEALHRYLHAHDARARYELATSTAAIAGPLIVRDALPILPITSWFGRPVVTKGTLVSDVRTGRVRYMLLDETGCKSKRAPSCAPAIRWALAHSTRVTRAAGLKRPRVLLRLD